MLFEASGAFFIIYEFKKLMDLIFLKNNTINKVYFYIVIFVFFNIDVQMNMKRALKICS